MSIFSRRYKRREKRNSVVRVSVNKTILHLSTLVVLAALLRRKSKVLPCTPAGLLQGKIHPVPLGTQKERSVRQLPSRIVLLLCLFDEEEEQQPPLTANGSAMRRSSFLFACLLVRHETFAFLVPARNAPLFFTNHPSSATTRTLTLHAESVQDKNRRILWTKKAVQAGSIAIGATLLVSLTRPVWAAGGSKSRPEGYKIQKTEDEWKAELSPIQYDILRRGGTENPGFSILEKGSGVVPFVVPVVGRPFFRVPISSIVVPVGLVLHEAFRMWK